MASGAEALHTERSVEVLRSLDDEQAELWAAAEWGPEVEPVPAVAITADLWWYAFLRGRLGEARVRQERALAVCPSDRPDLRAGVLPRLHRLHPLRPRPLRGRHRRGQRLRGAVVVPPRPRGLADPRVGERLVLPVSELPGQLQEMGVRSDDSVEVPLREDDGGHAAALPARVHGDRGEPGPALSRARAAVRVADGVGEAMARAFASDVLAGLLLEGGALDSAQEHCVRALGLYRDVGYREGEASALQRRGDIAQDRGAVAEAVTSYADAFTVASQLGHPRAMAQAVESLAGAAADRAPESAAVLLGAAAAMRAEIGATPSPAAIRSRDRCADALRSRLGAATFTEAWTTGRQLRPVRALQVTRRFLDQLSDGSR